MSISPYTNVDNSGLALTLPESTQQAQLVGALQGYQNNDPNLSSDDSNLMTSLVRGGQVGLAQAQQALGYIRANRLGALNSLAQIKAAAANPQNTAQGQPAPMSGNQQAATPSASAPNTDQLNNEITQDLQGLLQISDPSQRYAAAQALGQKYIKMGVPQDIVVQQIEGNLDDDSLKAKIAQHMPQSQSAPTAQGQQPAVQMAPQAGTNNPQVPTAQQAAINPLATPAQLQGDNFFQSPEGQALLTEAGYYGVDTSHMDAAQVRQLQPYIDAQKERESYYNGKPQLIKNNQTGQSTLATGAPLLADVASGQYGDITPEEQATQVARGAAKYNLQTTQRYNPKTGGIESVPVTEAAIADQYNTPSNAPGAARGTGQAPPQGLPAIGSERDLAARTIMGEGGDSPTDMKAVASVIRNRAATSGQSPVDVINAKGQFEARDNPTTWANLNGTSQSNPRYQAALQAYDDVTQNGSIGNWDHYYSPAGQTKLGRNAPAWDNGNGTQIGGNKYFALGDASSGRLPNSPSGPGYLTNVDNVTAAQAAGRAQGLQAQASADNLNAVAMKAQNAQNFRQEVAYATSKDASNQYAQLNQQIQQDRELVQQADTVFNKPFVQAQSNWNTTLQKFGINQPATSPQVAINLLQQKFGQLPNGIKPTDPVAVIKYYAAYDAAQKDYQAARIKAVQKYADLNKDDPNSLNSVEFQAGFNQAYPAGIYSNVGLWAGVKGSDGKDYVRTQTSSLGNKRFLVNGIPQPGQ
jgi:hypothetical protein